MVAARQNIGLVVRWSRGLRASRQLLAFFVLGLSLLGDLAMAAESRVALVIGNKDYRKGALTYSINDSRAMREALTRLGFRVVYRENLKSNEIGSTLQEFRSKLEPGAVALFYYSGHGSQYRGVNYLHSVNDESTNEFELAQYNLTANQVLSVMVEAKTRVNLVMLDACRDNPFKSFGRGVEEGLARMIGPAGTLISFATHPGAIAKDDGPDGHGLYTGFLLKFLSSSPDLEVERIFKLVSNEVFRYSKGSQIPWIEGVMLGDDFCFGACRSSVSTPPSPSQISAAALADQNVPQPRPAAPPAPAAPTAPPAQAPVANAKPRTQAPAISSIEADVESCKQKVFAACERAAKAGNAIAQGNLGWHYVSGEGVTKNFEQAAYWYRKAADQGDIYSQKTLGHFYFFNIGVQKDNTQSFNWYQKAAEQGDLEAYLMLVQYIENRYVSADRSQAVYWLKKAIDQGHAAAMYHLARFYERNQYFGFDPEQAKYWDAKCVELEVPFCQLKEAWRLIDVGWLSAERKQGLELIHKLANRGFGPAQLDLGRLYAKGKYVDKDEAQAVQWLRKALEQGQADAQEELKKFGY